MEIKEFKIVIPDGIEIDKENSTFECIKFKSKESGIKTLDDLKEISGYFIEGNLSITGTKINSAEYIDKNIAATEKHCKKMLAIAKIIQLMPYYGGAITNEEWGNNSLKYVISRTECYISKDFSRYSYKFLAFHTSEQRDEFLNNNEQLVKDYLML